MLERLRQPMARAEYFPASVPRRLHYPQPVQRRAARWSSVLRFHRTAAGVHRGDSQPQPTLGWTAGPARALAELEQAWRRPRELPTKMSGKSTSAHHSSEKRLIERLIFEKIPSTQRGVGRLAGLWTVPANTNFPCLVSCC